MFVFFNVFDLFIAYIILKILRCKYSVLFGKPIEKFMR